MPNPPKVLVPDDGIRFNAVIDTWTGMGDFHASGYRNAAEILLRRFIEDPDGTVTERDKLILPILFLFRHYLELRLKDIIVGCQVLTGKAAEYRHGHHLRKLWDEARELCEEVYGAGAIGCFEKVEECVADLCQLDPNSESFRYPRDKSGRPLFQHLVIGLKSLLATVGSIGDCLDKISKDLSAKLQQVP